MPYVLGIDLGHTRTTAAVCRSVEDAWLEPEVVPLDGGAGWVESVLRVATDGSVLIGRQAAARLDPERNVRGLLRRVGDPVPLVVGAQAYPAEVLAAALAGGVADQVAEVYGWPPARIVLNHPPGWGPHRLRSLSEALEAAGLPGALLVPTPVAAAECHANTDAVEVGTLLATCRLGGEHVESAFLRRTASGFELLGHAGGGEPRAGVLIDDLLLGHVLAKAGDQRPPPDSLAAIRADCVRAKERLSARLEAVVPVPGADDVPVTRREFEHLARPVLEAAAGQLRHLVSRAPADQFDAATLVGGSARIPMAGLLVESALRVTGCTPRVDPDPGTAICRGAALIARQRMTPYPENSSPGTPDPGAAPHPAAADPRPRDAELPSREGTGDGTALRELQPVGAGVHEAGELDDAGVGPPPPRPPVEITPLEAPRRFGSRRRASRGDDRDEGGR